MILQELSTLCERIDLDSYGIAYVLVIIVVLTKERCSPQQWFHLGIRQRMRLGPTNLLVRAEETALTIEKRL